MSQPVAANIKLLFSSCIHILNECLQRKIIKVVANESKPKEEEDDNEDDDERRKKKNTVYICMLLAQRYLTYKLMHNKSSLDGEYSAHRKCCKLLVALH